MKLSTVVKSRVWRATRLSVFALILIVTAYYFLLPGIAVLRDLNDPAMRGTGIPRRAKVLHRDLSAQIEAWARDRIVTRTASDAALHDVPTTEWPMFTAVFYLMATENMAKQRAFDGEAGTPPEYAHGAIEASKDLLLDPSHHTWVRTHWGDDYMHDNNVFFRALIIAGLTSYENLTHNGSTLPVLREQVDSLAAILDASPLGVLDDYPGECYPIDVLGAVAFIRRADAVLGTDHSEFVARELRAFQGPMADPLGLVPYRMDLPSGRHVQEARGIGNSWIAMFAPELWPVEAAEWHETYTRHFWQDRGWASGFREYPRTQGEPEWTFEIDAGFVLDGFGTAASAFGIGGARRNGRLDQAYELSAEMIAMSWPLPNGTLLGPRTVSHAADAPYLGESAIMYFLTVQPARGARLVRGGTTPVLVYAMLALYFGVSAVVAWGVYRRVRENIRSRPSTARLRPLVGVTRNGNPTRG